MDGRNRVERRRDGTIVKRHGGVGGAARAAIAAAALRRAADHDLPVPQVWAVHVAALTMSDVGAAITGATLLARSPVVVLHAIGSFSRRLHRLAPPPEPELPTAPGARPAAGATWVHGDLCPVNVLFGHDEELVAVVDWEDSHVGDPLVDLVWTEWLVRAWHGDAVPRLGALYDAYGSLPPVDARRRAMVSCLIRQRERESDPAARAAWDRRVTAVADMDLSL